MAIIKKEGGNGKVIIDTEKGLAVKTLKTTRGRESKIRYKNEMLALQKIQKERVPNVVEILNINEETNEIVMKAYDGDLTDIFSISKNNPQGSANLLLPVVNALKTLSSLESPIYHRDLKPANILYKLEDGNPVLCISDFGCCYFEQEDARQTPQFRAVGAQSYRAPEYDYGRVEMITEKGDVYSLGKILWAMINGVKGEIFPYTLWFPDEYNILMRFPQSAELTYANLIIAKCVSINPDERPSYDELIELLGNLRNPISIVSAEKQLRVKLFSAKRDYELVEVKALNRNILVLFYQDFDNLLSEISKRYDGFPLLSHLKNEFDKTIAQRDRSIDHKVSLDVRSYIFSTSYDNIYFAVHYLPTYSCKDGSADDRFASIRIDYRISSSNESGSLTIAYKNKNLETTYNGIRKLYSRESINTFLEDMVDKYIISFH